MGVNLAPRIHLGLSRSVGSGLRFRRVIGSVRQIGNSAPSTRRLQRFVAPTITVLTGLFAGAHWLSLLRYVRSCAVTARQSEPARTRGANAPPLAGHLRSTAAVRKQRADPLFLLAPPPPSWRTASEPSCPASSRGLAFSSAVTVARGTDAGPARVAPLRRTGLWPGRCRRWHVAPRCQEQASAQAAGEHCTNSCPSAPPAAAAAYQT